MKAETCLNLCEIEEFNCIHPAISSTREKITFNRIYIGSYFCDEMFIRINYDKLMSLLDKISNSYKVTLVVPIFCQKNLEKGKVTLWQLIKKYREVIDEITVNDYGMLSTVTSLENQESKENRSCHDKNRFSTINHSKQLKQIKLNHIKINMGRLFFKDYRDPRYETYFEKIWKPKVFTEYLKAIIEKYKINEIEIDVTHQSLDLSDSPKCIVGIHTPYTYMTTGKICEFASMYRAVQKKFRPNIDCSKECLKSVITYGMEENRKWFRIGRTVYFENNCIKLSNFDEKCESSDIPSTESNIRIIYFPVNELIKVC